LKSGSKLPHSEGALRAQKVFGISHIGGLSLKNPGEDPGTRRNFNRWTGASAST